MTKRRRKLHALCLIAAISICATAALSQRDGPHAVFPEPTWDFGYVPQKSEVNHTFYLHNRGSASLTVGKVEVDCSCASASEIDEPIAPGDSAAITVTFKSGRYRGRISKSAKVETGDTVRPIHRLRIRAEVIREDDAAGSLSVVPPKLKWKTEESRLKPSLDTVLVANNSDNSLDVKLLYYPQEIIDQVGFSKALKSGDTLRIVLSATGEKLPGEVKGLSTTFLFEGKDTSIVTIPIELGD